VLATEDVADQPVVSLHAIACIRIEATMDLYVHVHGHHLLTLLDSGSTHNFINVGVICHLQLVTSDSANMRVTVANLDRVACEGVAHNVALSIDREDFSISCYGIDLGVFNLVLGIDFLRTLGPFCGTSRNSFGHSGRRGGLLL
jgi:hypothetical protein